MWTDVLVCLLLLLGSGITETALPPFSGIRHLTKHQLCEAGQILSSQNGTEQANSPQLREFSDIAAMGSGGVIWDG